MAQPKHTKASVVDHVASVTGLSKGVASDAVNGAIDFIRRAVHDGGIQLHGIGVFSTVTRAARAGRNPRTGEALKIAAKTAVKFRAAKALVEAGS